MPSGKRAQRLRRSKLRGRARLLPGLFSMKAAQQELRPPDLAKLNVSMKAPGQGIALAIRFQTSNRGREQWQHDFTRQRHRVQGEPWGLLRRCATYSKVRTVLRKCASWKIPTIPSKMRTENCAPSRKPCAKVVPSVVTRPIPGEWNHWEFAPPVHTLRHFLP